MKIISDKKFLHQVSSPVQKINNYDVIKLVKEVRNQTCVSLSMCQIGKLERIFAMKFENSILVFINPEIEYKFGRFKSIETCLSLPGQRYKVWRPRYVEVSAMNDTIQKFRFKAFGVYAACMEHEIEHMDGILLEDKEWIQKLS